MKEWRSDVQRKPTMSNLISPYDAMAIPMTMVDTLANFLKSGAARPKIQVARSVATAFVACLAH